MTITRTIRYTPEKFVGLEIITSPLIVLYFISYIFLVRKYKKYIVNMIYITEFGLLIYKK